MKRKSDSKKEEIIKCPTCGSSKLRLLNPFFSMPDYKCKKCKRVFKIVKSCWLEIIV